MSFSDILSKLAEKKALQGDSDFAFRLISASEKEEEKEEKEAEMIKRGKDRKKVASKEVWIEAYEELLMRLIPKFMERGLGKDEAEFAAEKYLEKHSHLVDDRAGDLEGMAIDRAMMAYDDTYASTLSNMIKKYAGESEKGSYEDAIKNLPGFTGMFGNGFCFMNKAQAQKALAIGEQAANFLDWAVEKHDDGFMAISRGRDKKSSTLDSMIKKYAGEDKEDKKKTSQELEIERYNRERDKWDRMKKRWDKFKSENPLHKKSSTLVSMIKKYAKEDWEITGEEFYGGETPDLDFEGDDQFYEAMGEGYESGMRDPSYKKNPYNPVDHDDDVVRAWEEGFNSALEMSMQRGTKL
jgi:hypothetical protein